MREHYGWQFPNFETHLPRMLKKSIDKGLPAEYQVEVRLRSIELCKTKNVALDVGANVGLWSRDLVKSFNHVIAFEPVAIFRECLETNVKGDNFEEGDSIDVIITKIDPVNRKITLRRKR